MFANLFTLVVFIGACLTSANADGIVCGGPGNEMSTLDILGLVSTMNSNNFSQGPLPDSVLFGVRTSFSARFNSARLCIDNEFFFDRTHVSPHDMAVGAGDVTKQCCADNQEKCNGGFNTIHGDSGLPVILSVVPEGKKCKLDGEGLDADTVKFFIDAGKALRSIAAFIEGLFDEA